MTRRAIVAGLLFAGLSAQAWALAIYTCVDARGRRLTADRPIAECIDREQRELTPSGTLKRRIGPSLTAEERAAEDEKMRKAIEERTRVVEEKKREQALIARYPSRAVHDQERASSLALADEAIVLARKNMAQLLSQRKQLDSDLEFYKGGAKVPAQLKRKIEENQQHMEAQKRFIANQEGEKQRTNARFDEDLAKLRKLWALRAAPAPSALGAASPSAPVRK